MNAISYTIALIQKVVHYHYAHYYRKAVHHWKQQKQF